MKTRALASLSSALPVPAGNFWRETGRVFLGLGSNLEPRVGYLDMGVATLARERGFVLLGRAGTYATAPWGTSGGEFLNTVVAGLWQDTPLQLLRACQRIEDLCGRTRPYRWAPRTLDIDILFWEGVRVSERDLVIPHPLLGERAFALWPLLELEPDLGRRASDVPGALRLTTDLLSQGMRSFPPEPRLPDLSYVAVEGVIGVGKTTLARMLAERLDAELILEAAQENPFLTKFYQDPRRWAFQTQVFFLLSRYHQLGQLASRDLFAERIVCDYLFDKDGLFASVNLSEPELLLYEKIVPLLSEQLPRPELVIYLQANTDVLLDRIRKRRFPYERQIGRDYLDALNAAYNYFFFHYDQTPLLVVKTDEIDFVHRPEHFEDLLRQITRPVEGKEYYVPAP